MNQELLHIDDLSIGYQNPICTGIQAKVQKGELVGLTGKNGSGKSTLIRSLLGLQKIHSGSIHFKSENTKIWDVSKRAAEIAVVFSRLDQVPAIPVVELVALGRLPYNSGFSKLNKSELELIIRAIQLVGIEHLKTKLATQLSDGQLQMVMIARALVQDTDLIVMDEPTSHLDIENQFKIFELIYKLSKETGKTFIVASHQIELLLQNSSQLWWIEEGKFYAGFPEQVAFEQQIFEKLSQKRIQFDYDRGIFKFQHPLKSKINFQGDGSDLAYWTLHALERFGFEVDGNSSEMIQVNQGQIVFQERKYDNIVQFIAALNY